MVATARRGSAPRGKSENTRSDHYDSYVSLNVTVDRWPMGYVRVVCMSIWEGERTWLVRLALILDAGLRLLYVLSATSLTHIVGF